MNLKWFKKLFHIHQWHPIICKYAGFENRNVIYECRCGEMKEFEEYSNYYTGEGFSMDTTHGLAWHEYHDILKNGKNSKYYDYATRNRP